MQVQVSVRHGQLDEQTQQLIREKAEKLLHYFNRVSFIEVTVDLQNHDKQVEILVNAEHKHDFVARDAHPEVTAALDKALAKMEHQIHRYKEKIQDHRRDSSAGEGSPGYAT